jgi:hypothetical protein
MKDPPKLESVVLDPVLEIQRMLEAEMKHAPVFGSFAIKAVFHSGKCQRIVIKHTTSKLMDH